MMRSFVFSILVAGVCLNALSQNVDFAINESTGAITSLKVRGDSRDMNWILATDGSQYEWIGEDYGWGLGYFDVTAGGKRSRERWKTPVSVRNGGRKVIYNAGGIGITVTRSVAGKALVERYVFRNESGTEVLLDSMGIYTPFNDNYPDAETCVGGRAHAHIWATGNASYVKLVNMGAQAPHLSLMLTEGSLGGYEIWERHSRHSSSNFRGVFALSPEKISLAPGESYAIAWKIWSDNGWDDFFGKLVSAGGVYARLNRYVLEDGASAVLELFGPEQELKGCSVSVGGRELSLTGQKGCRRAEVVLNGPGEKRFEIMYGNGRKTYAECLVVSSYEGIISNRLRFIQEHQRMNSTSDPRYGAYMVYDNEQEQIYLNDTPNCSPGDRCEGAERVGMGVALAKYCLRHRDDALVASLTSYADFVRRGLQDAEYVTWRQMSHVSGNRAYNYPWIAEFYFLMYQITKDKQYAVHGYRTLKTLYDRFGYSFYVVGLPVALSLNCLQEAGMTEEYESLLSDYIKVGEAYIRNSYFYPKHEVNYEQSIVAPSVVFLLEMYLTVGDRKYLDEAEKQLPLLEAFGGRQPSFHLNDISIRHWDGYWFGKREMWGDVMPHYWSCISAMAYLYYSRATGREEYRERAERIVENNLCLFTEEGRGSCAYIFPDRVNGQAGKFYDPYANDQDWAISFFLDIK